MTPLCAAVKEHIGQFLALDDPAEFEIVSDGSETCRVRANDLEIRLYADPRDQQITSAIIFHGEEEFEDQEQLYTHIIARLFQIEPWNTGGAKDSLSEKVSGEISTVCQVIRSMRDSNTLPRDLLYFSLGYNSAYTDHYRDTNM